MEELNRLQASCKAFKGHVTRLHYKINELMNRDFDDYTTTSLTTAIEQIKKKGDKVAQMDERIATLLTEATELESATFDAEEFQDEIVDKIARATRYIELSTVEPSRRSRTSRANSQSDLSQSESEGENSDHTSTVEVSTESASSTVESGAVSTITTTVQAGPVSTIALSTFPLPVITPSSITPPVTIGSTNYVT